MFFAKAFRDNFSLIIDRFSSILPQVTGNGLNFIQYYPNRPTAEKANFESLIGLVFNLLSVKVLDKNRKI